MHRKQMFRIIVGILAIVALTLILGGSSRAAGQYKTIHRFNKQTGVRGRAPYSGLTIDAAGNLYGTTHHGGAFARGTVFELTPNGDGSWTKTLLHSFHGSDGANPLAGLIFDAAGNLYGTTQSGGAFQNGTVFELTPSGNGSWTESVLHSFNGTDGANLISGLIFDAAGNLYGTTTRGGNLDGGVVFELKPNGDGTWTESVLYSFNYTDGWRPHAGLIIDAAGNLYGTTISGGATPDVGTVFELTPNGDGSWTETLLHSFNVSDGFFPVAGLTIDAAGNLYGTATYGGGNWCPSNSSSNYCGVVFKLTPNADGSWTESVLHSFNGSDGSFPQAGLIFDAAGNLYGTTERGGVGVCTNGCGTVFKLRPTLSGTWRFRVLHKFMGTPGAYPSAGLVLDQTGNLYGTTVGDGKTTFGSVYEITP